MGCLGTLFEILIGILGLIIFGPIILAIYIVMFVLYLLATIVIGIVMLPIWIFSALLGGKDERNE